MKKLPDSPITGMSPIEYLRFQQEVAFEVFEMGLVKLTPQNSNGYSTPEPQKTNKNSQ